MKIMPLKTKNNYNQKSLKGFTLGVAMIMMGILVTVSLGMSVLLLRDLKQASLTESSSRAYNLADGFMTCLVSYENTIRNYDNGVNIGGLFPENISFSYDSKYKDKIPLDNVTNLVSYDKTSLTCFDKQIFDETGTGLNKTQILPAGSNDPLDYQNGGVKTNIKIQTDEMEKKMNNTCLEADIYAKPGKDKLFIVRSRTPCTGSKVIERVIARYIQ